MKYKTTQKHNINDNEILGYCIDRKIEIRKILSNKDADKRRHKQQKCLFSIMTNITQ